LNLRRCENERAQEIEMNKSSSLQRAGRVWIALTVIVLLVLVAVILGAAQREHQMSSGAASSGAEQLLQAASGTKIKVVVEVEKQTNGMFISRVLDPRSETVYTRTKTPVTILAADTTRYVMGKSADLHPAAVIHVTGTIDSDRHVKADQIVILTGYVQVH
jgi:hypothetical protein